MVRMRSPVQIRQSALPRQRFLDVVFFCTLIVHVIRKLFYQQPLNYDYLIILLV